MSDVTVVIACFNYGRFLDEAVRSALSQSGSPQVVVVDDGSTDPATHAALDALPPQVQVVRQANAGVSAARNAGLARANTPFVVALDADDRLAPGAIEILRDALARHPEAGFAYGHQRFFGDWQGEMRFPPYDPLRLLDRHLIGPTALVRREVFADIGGYDESFPLYEDWELWLAALARGWHGVRVDAVTHEYRRHGPSKLTTDRRRYRELRRQLRTKHAALYAGRRALRKHSTLGPAGRLVYRWFWGPRPVPAVVEQAAYALLWGRVSRRGRAAAIPTPAAGPPASSRRSRP
jgi:glycosyltransferase involved in cell wall biosynthesis